MRPPTIHDEISIRRLAEELIPDGHNYVRALRSTEPAPDADLEAFTVRLQEILSAHVQAAFEQSMFVASKLVTTRPSPIPSEDSPTTTRHGLIIPITRDVLGRDRTHLVLNRAAEVGEVLGRDKEKRVLDRVLGLTDEGQYTEGVNALAGNPLHDWGAVGKAAKLLSIPHGRTVLVMPANRHTAIRLFPTYPRYHVAESRLAYRRLIFSGVPVDDAKKWWFIGDFRRAFAYVESWPIAVTVCPPPTECPEGTVLRFKASERGVAVVTDSSQVVRNTP